ncbi:MAG: hypothetical protein [Bacteriophage sp.]|nr:MAG: hypothetical protein [Bacteriophage sp.]
MQSSTSVVKFNKKAKVAYGVKDEETRNRMRKRDKVQRGGGAKGAFLEGPESSVNQGAYYIQHEG